MWGRGGVRCALSVCSCMRYRLIMHSRVCHVSPCLLARHFLAFFGCCFFSNGTFRCRCDRRRILINWSKVTCGSFTASLDERTNHPGRSCPLHPAFLTSPQPAGRTRALRVWTLSAEKDKNFPLCGVSAVSSSRISSIFPANINLIFQNHIWSFFSASCHEFVSSCAAVSVVGTDVLAL